MNFAKMIEKEIGKISSMLHDIAEEFREKISYKKKFSELAEKIEEAIRYVKRMGI